MWTRVLIKVKDSIASPKGCSNGCFLCYEFGNWDLNLTGQCKGGEEVVVMVTFGDSG